MQLGGTTTAPLVANSNIAHEIAGHPLALLIYLASTFSRHSSTIFLLDNTIFFSFSLSGNLLILCAWLFTVIVSSERCRASVATIALFVFLWPLANPCFADRHQAMLYPALILTLISGIGSRFSIPAHYSKPAKWAGLTTALFLSCWIVALGRVVSANRTLPEEMPTLRAIEKLKHLAQPGDTTASCWPQGISFATGLFSVGAPALVDHLDAVVRIYRPTFVLLEHNCLPIPGDPQLLTRLLQAKIESYSTVAGSPAEEFVILRREPDLR
jgi:hypothetical protein